MQLSVLPKQCFLALTQLVERKFSDFIPILLDTDPEDAIVVFHKHTVLCE